MGTYSPAEKLRLLRADIEQGIRSLDAGKGKKLDIEEVIRRVRERTASLSHDENDS